MSQHHHITASSSFTSCFFPITTADNHPSAPLPPPPPPPPPPPQTGSGKPNLTTCLYQTHLGLLSLTWSRTFLGHSLHLNLHPFDFSSSPASSSPLYSLSTNSPSLSTLSFHLHIKPFLFWKKHGSKKITTNTSTTDAASAIRIFWDLSRAKFGSGPEPQSGFYIAVVFDGEMTLLVGDSTKQAYSKTKAQKTPRTNQVLVLRREHVFGGSNKVYSTKARFGGKTREISVDCSVDSDARLSFSVDNKRVLQIKKLKWKFRGNERVEVDGVPIQFSWDVYNWMFEDLKNSSNNVNNRHAVFMFRFENLENNDEEDEEQQQQKNSNGVVSWQPQQQQQGGSWSFGTNGIEWRKMMKKSLMMRTARSSSLSSISMSSASSSGCSSSVMEWASTEESELCPGFNGFSLLVYVWKK
ncbi:hypothetical protein ACOSP7_008071 [Xanthoceras sorbifolium]